MYKVLIPTDFSESAHNAFRYAYKLMGNNAEYIFLNSYEEPHTSTGSMISIREILHEASVDNLKEEEAWVKTVVDANAQVSFASEYGGAVESIRHAARKESMDMIVMGTTGATGIREAVLGSVASGVVGTASCPVLAVPGSFRFTEPKRVLFAFDLKHTKKGLPDIFTWFMKACDSNVTVLTVSKDGKPIGEDESEKGYDMHVHLEGIPHGFDVILGTDIESSITRYAHDNGMNLVVTIPRKSSWFGRLFNPSVSKKLARHLSIPILALVPEVED